MALGVSYQSDLVVPPTCPTGATRDPVHHTLLLLGRRATKGLLPVLRQCLWPRWTYIAPRLTGRRRRTGGSSCAEGLRVEEQIGAWFAEFAATRAEPAPCRNQYARGFCRWVVDGGYIMAASQWPVFDPIANIGTAFDYILYSPARAGRGEAPWIAVELKVGYNYGRTLAQGTFSHADFGTIPCTPTNMAYAQLTAMCAIASECYGVNFVPIVAFVHGERKVTEACIARSAVYKRRHLIRGALVGAPALAPPLLSTSRAHTRPRRIIVVDDSTGSSSPADSTNGGGGGGGGAGEE